METNLQERVASALTKKELSKKVPKPISTTEAGRVRQEERKLEAKAPKTGYKDFDLHIKGWIPGHVYILSGETNAGKSACASNFAVRAALQGAKVTYFSLEPDYGIVDYMVGVLLNKRWDEITEDDLLIPIPNVSIFTKETHSKLDQLVQTIENMERQDLIIVDHFGYFTNDSGDRRSETQQQSDAIKRIVGAAKKKKSAVMLIAHLRKPPSQTSKLPSMNDISGSAAFKQDATDVMIINMTKDESDTYKIKNSPDGVIMLPKVKTGTSGTVRIHFIPNSPIMIDQNDMAHRLAGNFEEDGMVF